MLIDIIIGLIGILKILFYNKAIFMRKMKRKVSKKYLNKTVEFKVDNQKPHFVLNIQNSEVKSKEEKVNG